MNFSTYSGRLRFLSVDRLTAFVAKSFAQARAFIPEYIDDKLLEDSLEWMARQTNSDGSFRKVGAVHSSGLKVRYLLFRVSLPLSEMADRSRSDDLNMKSRLERPSYSTYGVAAMSDTLEAFLSSISCFSHPSARAVCHLWKSCIASRFKVDLKFKKVLQVNFMSHLPQISWSISFRAFKEIDYTPSSSYLNSRDRKDFFIFCVIFAPQPTIRSE